LWAECVPKPHVHIHVTHPLKPARKDAETFVNSHAEAAFKSYENCVLIHSYQGSE